MYSVVLAALMTTQSAAPAWGHGCHGCWGGSNAFSCGCCGGCWGCGGGCWGSCYGCYGCWGGCNGCYGCLGGYAYAALPATASATYATAPAAQANQAEIVVQVPAEARLYVDGQLVNLNSSTRRIVTPPLENGKEYFYVLKAEATRDGKVQRAQKRVSFHAGDVARVDLESLNVASADATALAPARLTVHVPQGAQLFANDTLVGGTGLVRSLQTPALTPGQDYYYTLRAELLVNGQTRSETHQVHVSAGKSVNVDFDELAPVTTVSR